MKFILSSILILFTFQSYSQSDCPCCDTEYDQFDFWIGEWTVTDTSGKVLGHNTIKSLESNCLISEHWRGKSGVTGRSFNYFTSSDSTWNQVWVSSSGNNLVLKGKYNSGNMILTSKLQEDKNRGKYFNRITWIENKDGTVSQIWDILNADGVKIRTAFHGIYKPINKE